ncbi:IS481 family transposase, partial [Vibrio cholerae]
YQEILSTVIKSWLRRGGIDALINRSRRAPNLKNRVDSET